MTKRYLGSKPSLLLTMSISLSLAVLGAFAIMLLHANYFSNYLSENLSIQVFLDRSVTEVERKTIYQQLNTRQAVSNIKFVSKEVAAKNFIAETGEEFASFLGENPLRDAYEVHLRADSVNVRGMKSYAAFAKAQQGVFEVIYIENLVDALSTNLSKVLAFLGGLAFILIGVTIILINNTIRLSLHSQRFLIRSMQLVGAYPWFIKKPFVWRNAIQGAFAGLLAGLLLYGFQYFLTSNLPESKTVVGPAIFALIVASLTLLGTILGALSSFFAINRYLKLSLSQLH